MRCAGLPQSSLLPLEILAPLHLVGPGQNLSPFRVAVVVTLDDVAPELLSVTSESSRSLLLNPLNDLSQLILAIEVELGVGLVTGELERRRSRTLNRRGEVAQIEIRGRDREVGERFADEVLLLLPIRRTRVTCYGSARTSAAASRTPGLASVAASFSIAARTASFFENGANALIPASLTKGRGCSRISVRKENVVPPQFGGGERKQYQRRSLRQMFELGDAVTLEARGDGSRSQRERPGARGGLRSVHESSRFTCGAGRGPAWRHLRHSRGRKRGAADEVASSAFGH
jgi:hypothetical protein